MDIYNFHQQNQRLFAQINAMKKQMASKEANWQKWKAWIQRAADSETAFRLKLQDELDILKWEKEKEIASLRQSLLHEQQKTTEVLKHNTVHDGGLDLVIKEKDEQIAKLSSDKRALEARLQEMETKIQSEAERKIKLTTPEDQRRSVPSAKTEAVKEKQEKEKARKEKQEMEKQEKEKARKEKQEMEKARKEKQEMERLKWQKEKKQAREKEEESRKKEGSKGFFSLIMSCRHRLSDEVPLLDEE